MPSKKSQLTYLSLNRDKLIGDLMSLGYTGDTILQLLNNGLGYGVARSTLYRTIARIRKEQTEVITYDLS